MSKYKVWSLDDIKQEINKLEKLSNFKLDPDVEILINNRLRKSLGICWYKYVNRKTKIDKIEFSKNLIDGTVCEEEVLDTIIHEFAHAYTDHNKPENKTKYTDGHTKEWRDNDIKLGGSGEQFYKGNEFTYIKKYNKTFSIQCNKCGKIYDICDMVVGSQIKKYYNCTNMTEGHTCKGKFEVIEDISSVEKSLKIIKKYVKNMLHSCDNGEEHRAGIYVFKSKNIKHIDWGKFRMTYKDKTFAIQIDNKFDSNEEFKKDYDKLVQDVKEYLQDKNRFKFINNLEFKHLKGDKYSYSFKLDIDTLDLASV